MTEIQVCTECGQAVQPRNPQLKVESQASGVNVAVPSSRSADMLTINGLTTPQRLAQRTEAAFRVFYGKKRTELHELAFRVEVTPRPLPPKQWSIRATAIEHDCVPVNICICVSRVDENGQQILDALTDPGVELPDVVVRAAEHQALAIAVPRAALPANLTRPSMRLNLQAIPLDQFRSVLCLQLAPIMCWIARGLCTQW